MNTTTISKKRLGPRRFHIWGICFAALLIAFSPRHARSNDGAGVEIPDLSILSLSVTCQQNSRLNVDAQISNNGAVDAGPFTVGVYFSADPIITTSDTLFAFSDFVGLTPGIQVAAIGDVFIDLSQLGLAPGTYYVGAVADINNQVVEFDETNNSVLGHTILLPCPGTVTPTPTPGPEVFADLTVSSLSGTCNFDGTIHIESTINNIGAAASGPFDLGFYLSTDSTITTDDTFFGVSTFDVGIAAGDFGRATGDIFVDLVDLGIPPGTYFIGAIADDLSAVVESNEANNTLAGDTLTLPCEESFLVVDFTGGGGNANGWVGGIPAGFGGSTSLTANGLCMTVPELGDNFALWVSPERYVELTDNVVYRSRAFVNTDQTAPNTIPLFFFVYDNFNTGGIGNNFGGFSWVLDVAGGANGIGRAQGRSQFDFYFAPNPIVTPQWTDNAFTPGADAFNDMRFQYRIIDADPNLGTNLDFGTICVSRLEMTAIPRESLAVDSVLYNPPLSTETVFAQANDEVATGGNIVINNTTNQVSYDLPSGTFVRKTLGPFNPNAGADLNLQLYPVVWEANTLYRVQSSIFAQSSILDPVDVIFLAADTATVELGTAQFSTRGSPGGVFDLAASPRLAAATYETYFYSQNATLSPIANTNRLRPLAIFINSGDIAGPASGGDTFIVESLEVQRLVLP